ncbi:hypothetical protein CYMTET_36377, partial [Cymbomonas tetramitiformis]
MSEDQGLCSECGKHEVIWDFPSSTEVCAACGHVVSEGELVSHVEWDSAGGASGQLIDYDDDGADAARRGLAGMEGAGRSCFRRDAAKVDLKKKASHFTTQLQISRDASDQVAYLLTQLSPVYTKGRNADAMIAACIHL